MRLVATLEMLLKNQSGRPELQKMNYVYMKYSNYIIYTFIENLNKFE